MHLTPKQTSTVVQVILKDVRLIRNEVSGILGDVEGVAVTVIGERVVKDILAIQGVRKIQIKPKEVRVKKDPGASWGEIEKKVVETLNRAFRRKQFKVI